MDSKAFFTALVAVVIIGSCLGQDCPTSPMDAAEWSINATTSCLKAMMKSLREDTDKANCGDIVSENDNCRTEKVTTCESAAEDNQLKAILGSMSMMPNMAQTFNSIFCTGEALQNMETATGIVSDLQIADCDPTALSNAIEPCSNDFLTVFRADPLDTQLCQKYDEMAACEFQTIKDDDVCPDVKEMTMTLTENLRKAANFFCAVNEDEDVNTTDGNGDEDGGNDDVGDGGKDGVDIVKFSIFGILTLSLLSISYSF